MIRDNIVAAVSCLLVLCVVPQIEAQQSEARVQSTQAAAKAEFEHAMHHLQQLATIAHEATPTKTSRDALNHLVVASLKNTLTPVITDKTLPQTTRASAQRLVTGKNVDELVQIFAQTKSLQSPASFSLSNPNKIVVASVPQQVMQVLTTNAPAYGIPAPHASGNNPTTGGPPLSPINNCRAIDGIYPVLNKSIVDHSPKYRALADSVGRIEIKKLVPQLSYTIVGTGFVVNKQKGLVVSACHVANEIADQQVSGGWMVPARKWGADATILIDFGETDDHDVQREFRISAVVFLPMIQGCDGAILQVDPASGHLPAPLAVATTEPSISAIAPVDVISIGYPSRDLTPPTGEMLGNVTQATYDYFACVRLAAPKTAKFLFGGKVTGDESQGAYHILPHIVPTAPGQSGSPIINVADPNHPVVIGVHICCVQTAQVQSGNKCELRNEEYLQEAVSIVDIMKLYEQQPAVSASLAPY